MTITQFRNHKYLPSEWSKLMRTSGILQKVIQVLEENHPARFALTGDNNADVSPTRASIELGVTRGYSQALDRLRLLAEPIPNAIDIGPPTYEPTKVEEPEYAS